MVHEDLGIDSFNYSGGAQTSWDDVSGLQLDDGMVACARRVEIEYFKSMNAYTRVPRSQALSEGAKVITLRWIDVNKGDRESPNYSLRLVGREFKEGKDDSLYAATPPLEAMRLILSHAATASGGDIYGKEIMVNDVSRAYFHARPQRKIYVELPAEDEEAQEGEVGLLNVCLYGTREAARGWQQTLS